MVDEVRAIYSTMLRGSVGGYVGKCVWFYDIDISKYGPGLPMASLLLGYLVTNHEERNKSYLHINAL